MVFRSSSARASSRLWSGLSNGDYRAPSTPTHRLEGVHGQDESSVDLIPRPHGDPGIRYRSAGGVRMVVNVGCGLVRRGDHIRDVAIETIGHQLVVPVQNDPVVHVEPRRILTTTTVGVD